MRNIIITIVLAIAGAAATGLAIKGINGAIIYSGSIAVLILLIYIIYGFGNISLNNDLKHVLVEVGDGIRERIKKDNKTILSDQTKELVMGINENQKQLFATAITIIRVPDVGKLSIPKIDKAYQESLQIFGAIAIATKNN